MELKGALAYLQKPACCPYSEPEKSNLRTPVLFL